PNPLPAQHASFATAHLLWALAGRSSRSNAGGKATSYELLVEQKLGEGLQYACSLSIRGLAATSMPRSIVASRKSARGNANAALTIAEQGMGVILARGYSDSTSELGKRAGGYPQSSMIMS
ncbi:unnamed protein product, partial [Ectocarpus sp. 12 AP-2014]